MLGAPSHKKANLLAKANEMKKGCCGSWVWHALYLCMAPQSTAMFADISVAYSSATFQGQVCFVQNMKLTDSTLYIWTDLFDALVSVITLFMARRSTGRAI